MKHKGQFLASVLFLMEARLPATAAFIYSKKPTGKQDN